MKTITLWLRPKSEIGTRTWSCQLQWQCGLMTSPVEVELSRYWVGVAVKKPSWSWSRWLVFKYSQTSHDSESQRPAILNYRRLCLSYYKLMENTIHRPYDNWNEICRPAKVLSISLVFPLRERILRFQSFISQQSKSRGARGTFEERISDTTIDY